MHHLTTKRAGIARVLLLIPVGHLRRGELTRQGAQNQGSDQPFEHCRLALHAPHTALSWWPYPGLGPWRISAVVPGLEARDGCFGVSPMIEFHNYDGTYSGVDADARMWRISPNFMGWELEFRDPGDRHATIVGTHRTLVEAQREAARQRNIHTEPA